MPAKSSRVVIIIRTSLLSILANFVLAGFKAMVGLFSHSTAILSDSLHNLSDALSGLITIIGVKLASKPSSSKTPNHIEHITAIIIASIIILAGLHILIESIEKIITPAPVDYTATTIVILVVAILIKFALGVYMKRQGRAVESDALIAGGVEALNDSILSISVLITTLIYIIFHLDIEAYVGALLSLYIIYTGIILIRTSCNKLSQVPKPIK